MGTAVNKVTSLTLLSDDLIYPRFNIALLIEFLDVCRGFLGQVESVISDPVCLLASTVAKCCIFH